MKKIKKPPAIMEYEKSPRARITEPAPTRRAHEPPKQTEKKAKS